MGGTVRVVRTLVALKKKYLDRVVLVLGNRDLNKLRMTAELSDADMARQPDTIPGPHWDPAAPTLAAHLKSTGQQDSRAERLRYMYKHTLGGQCKAPTHSNLRCVPTLHISSQVAPTHSNIGAPRWPWRPGWPWRPWMTTR